MMKKRNTTYRLNIVDYLIFIFCSLAAAAALFLFYRDLNSYTIKQAEEPVAKIYFKKNTAQRKFVDNDIWEVLTNSSDIYDGDRIRTSKDSEAYTEFNDSGIQIQLREKSMVQIFKSKKERSVDFIGGEIFVANNSPEEKVVVRSGKKEIAVSQSSEVKLALPEVSEAAAAGAEEAEESPVIIEVLSGQVEVIEQAAETKGKKEKLETLPLVLSAGETVTLLPQNEVLPVLGAGQEANLSLEEKKKEIEESVKEAFEETVEKKSEPIKAKEEVTPEPAASVPVLVQTYEPPKPIEAGVEKTKNMNDVPMLVNYWGDRAKKEYNYAANLRLADVTEANKTIPAGSILEVTLSGRPSKDIPKFTIQISTGDVEWEQAHQFKNYIPDNGLGLLKDTPFTFTTQILLDKDIVNTNDSNIGINYGADILDEMSVIYNFVVAVKVISVEKGAVITKVSDGYTKTLEYENLTFPVNQWGSKSDEYEFRFDVDAADIFGDHKSISKGSKIKITLSGSCDRDLYGMRPELEDTSKESWIQILMNDADRDYEAAKINGNLLTAKNKEFNLSKEYDVYTDLPDTTFSIFHLQVDHGNNKKNPTFTNLKISFEVE